MTWLKSLLLLLAAITLSADPGHAADRASFLDLARTGWNYRLRTATLPRGTPIRIHGQALAGAALCLVGEPPSPLSTQVLTTFGALARHVFGKPLPMRYAGPEARGCGPGRTVVVRLYSGRPPNAALTRDLDWLNRAYQIGLPRRFHAAGSPAMAQTFFGRRGTATHLMVQQSPAVRPGSLEESYFRSILIEELFQSFTFGMDVLVLHRSPRFLSKLQEVPLNIHRLPWGSPAFMAALLSSNPSGLCEFDLFMMHAVAQTPVRQTTDPSFIDFIDRDFDRLVALTDATQAEPRFASILDPDCRAIAPDLRLSTE